MVNRNVLARVSKGIYCRPEKTRFAVIAVNESEIIKYFTGNGNNGVIIGYQLYNRESLTTQVPKTTDAFLEMVLNHYGVKNTLSKHLSGTSRYAIPAVEGINEITH